MDLSGWRLENALVVNEIQYNPALTQSGFVELYHRSTTTAFDLSAPT